MAGTLNADLQGKGLGKMRFRKQFCMEKVFEEVLENNIQTNMDHLRGILDIGTDRLFPTILAEARISCNSHEFHTPGMLEKAAAEK